MPQPLEKSNEGMMGASNSHDLRREQDIRDLVARLDDALEALAGLDYDDDACGYNPRAKAEITQREADFIHEAAADAADFLFELNRDEIEARANGAAAS